MHHSHSIAIRTNAQFELEYSRKIQLLFMSPPVNRGAAHAMSDDTTSSTHEIAYLSEAFEVGFWWEGWAEIVKPNLPWANDHFLERISGQPLNPAPSEAWWPYARAGNAEHKSEDKFSHTYPERFWPRFAEVENLRMQQELDYDGAPDPLPRYGIRFPYGDLKDVITVLQKNPWSRQAYLPIWFPEDLTAARQGERVPCSMGYHFMMNGRTRNLDCVYTMRSCDIVRFYRDDIYMAGRLLQWISRRLETEQAQAGAGSAAVVRPGNLIVNIDNLHCFPGDKPFLEKYLPLGETQNDKRAGYNFGALG